MTELDALVRSLTSEPQVFGRSGRVADGGIQAEIHSLVLVAEEAWQDVDSLGGVPGLAALSDVAGALHTVTADSAEELLVELSVDDLVWPGDQHGDRECARDLARRVVTLLGPDTVWWTNRINASTWTPVTRHTYDGVVAGAAGDGTFAALLQVGED